MADDLRVNIIVDASQAERALRGVEAQAKQVAAAMTGISTAAETTAAKTTQATQAMVRSFDNVTAAARRAAMAAHATGREVDTLEDRIASAKRLQTLQSSPSPYGAATGRAYTGLGEGSIGAASGLFGAGAFAAGAVVVTDQANNYIGDIDQRLGGGFSPGAQQLGAAAPLQAAKILGTNAATAFDTYAAALGKSADALDNVQRKQAVLNQAVREGNSLVAESVQYQQSAGGQFREARGRVGAGLSRAFSSIFLGDPDYLNNQTFGFGSAAAGGSGAPAGSPGSFVGDVYGGARGLYGGYLDYEAGRRGQQLRLQTFALQAQQALGQGGIDVAAFNRGQYADAASRYRAQLSAGQSSYLGGVNNLVGLQNQRGRFNESVQFNPGQGYTGTSTVFGESPSERTARIFAAADRFSDPAQRRAYLAASANGLDPASLSADQRDTIRQALDQSIVDQIQELGKQTALLAAIERHLANAEKKATGGPGHEYDSDPTPTTTVVLTNASDTDVVTSIRFADSAANTFTATGDTFAQDNY